MNKEQANKINILLVRFGFAGIGMGEIFKIDNKEIESLIEEIKKYKLIDLVEASNHPELDESKAKADDRLVSAIYTALHFPAYAQDNPSIQPIISIPIGVKEHHLILVSSDKP